MRSIEEDLLPTQSNGAGVLATAANTTKTVLGAGILTLSWAFFYSTMWPGVLFTVYIGFLSAYSYVILGRCSELTGMSAYSAIWTHCCGERTAWLPDLTIVVLTLTCALGYNIIIGDCVPRGLAGLGINWAPLQERRFAIIVVSVGIFPLHFVKDLSFLGYTSIVGTTGTLYTASVLAFEMVEAWGDQGDWLQCEFNPGIFLMAPAVAIAFNGHFNAPEMYSGLAKRSFSRWLAVTCLAFGGSSVVTVCCAVSGYIMFGSDLTLPGRSNVLTAPEFTMKPEVMIVYLATTLSVAFGLPLYLQGTRKAIDMLWLRSSPATAAKFGERCRSNLLSLFCVLFALGGSLAVQELGVVVAFAGAVASSLMVFVFPSLMYIRCVPRPRGGFGCAGALLHRGLPYLAIGTGTVVMILGVVTLVLQQLGFDLSEL